MIVNVCHVDKFLYNMFEEKKDFVRGCRNIEHMQCLKRKIFVDADSCPVKEEIMMIADEYETEIIFVSSYAHHSAYQNNKVEYVLVDSEKEAVDLYLMNTVRPFDIVVTQDYALASILLTRGAVVLSPRGKQYTEYNIDLLLDLRHFHSKQRRGGMRTKGPKAFTEEDRLQFCRTLRNLLETKKDFDEKGRIIYLVNSTYYKIGD